ncbi:MAG: glycerate kinase type-2 family protein [Spirochaetota bacterium]
MNTVDYTRDEALNAIIHAALGRADSAGIIARCVSVCDNTLEVTTEFEQLRFDLSAFDRVLVLGIGKAAARMARALEEVLGERIGGGVVVTKYGHAEPLSRVELIEAGHPVPDEAGVRAARRMAAVLEGADERTLIVSVISGGGSALLVDPFHDETHELSLEDVQEVTRLLLSSGATIQEINCVRKHLSNVKGGRLARLMAPATSVNLILSDVVGDEPASIASGITAADPTTYAEAYEITARYEVLDVLPAAARAIISDGAEGAIPETPSASEAIFDSVHNVIVGSNTQALQAAAAAARSAGYTTFVLTARLVGEAREAGKIFPGIARDIRETAMLSPAPVCVLAGGETTVTIRDESGHGGRNQELALSVLEEWSKAVESYRGCRFASVATDGNDGPTDAAGGLVDDEIAARAAEDRSSLRRALEHNDSYAYLDSHGALLRTGPTNTNVCDIQILLVDDTL